jgi:hypothetical protein
VSKNWIYRPNPDALRHFIGDGKALFDGGVGRSRLSITAPVRRRAFDGHHRVRRDNIEVRHADPAAPARRR